MKKCMSILLSCVVCCCYSFAQNPDIIERDLKETSNNTTFSEIESRQIKQKRDHHSLILTPPDTTKMTSNRRVVWMKEMDSDSIEITVDSIRIKTINSRWKAQ